MSRKNHGLTKSQGDVLEFVTNSLKRQGFAPSLTEIATHFNCAKATAQYYVTTLTNKGYLRRGKYKTRALATNDRGVVAVAKLGRIAAGQPIEAIEAPETISVAKSLFKTPSSRYYALEVVGNSMVEDGISDGDVILVKHQFTANVGETVVAILDNGHATLKTYKLNKGKPFLQAQNPQYDDIHRPFVIQGVVAGLVKQRV